jgi:hypothetical protein
MPHVQPCRQPGEALARQAVAHYPQMGRTHVQGGHKQGGGEARVVCRGAKVLVETEAQQSHSDGENEDWGDGGAAGTLSSEDDTPQRVSSEGVEDKADEIQDDGSQEVWDEEDELAQTLGKFVK